MKFNENGKFKILQLTDIHYEDGSEADLKTLKLMTSLIEGEKPDIIVVTGDTVYGPDNIKVIDKAFEPIIRSEIPWTFVLGNHDTEKGSGAEELFPAISELPGCLAFDDADIEGNGNHIIDIRSDKFNSCWRLVMLDSGTYINDDPKDGYDYIKKSQIEWYSDRIKELCSTYSKAGAISFFHIPLCEYKDAWDEGKCTGELREDICSSAVNSGLFEVMSGDNITRAVFVGHDHINNFCGKLDGVILGYGRATGYNTYSCEGYNHGARIIELSEDDTINFDTWERLDDGRVIKSEIRNL